MSRSSLMHVAACSQPQGSTSSPQPPIGQFRSLSNMSQSTVSPTLRSRSRSRSRSAAKSHPSSDITEIMIPSERLVPSTLQPKRTLSSPSLMEDQDHSTIPDPRVRAMSPANSNRPMTPSHHPDLDSEVAALSTKLINAINHQTNLDDTLSATRQELESARERVRDLEGLVARQQDTLSGDVWIKRKSAEGEKTKLLARVVEEKRLRAEVEKDKKKIEQELETLTVSLFEEANKMVITAKEEAKKEHDALRKKNELLRSQLADTQGLLKSQQEQLAELKLVMEHMTTERDDHSGTTPSSPGFSKFDARDDDTQMSEGGSHSGVLDTFSPTYPTNLAHLLQPVLRTDLCSFDDFVTLVQTSKKNAPSRASSGSYSGLNPIFSLTGGSASAAPSNASTASLSTVGTPTSNVSPQTPNTPASVLSSGSACVSAPMPPLKETKFYKRALAEDIEPTLRLDMAPGLSWLARRSAISAMTEGSLVVEPVPTNSPFASISKPQFYPCSLCGEARRDVPHLRNHRFRTSESDSAQRYPLCKYCLGRVRSTCDFLGFLRMVKDGHWRADDADAERVAWEESVRLREQMFWSRIGGGVVPVHNTNGHACGVGEKSARPSQEALRSSAEGPEKSIAVVPESAVPDKEPSSKSNQVDDASQHDQVSTVDTEKDNGQRLSLTIPGSFDEMTI
ncbi:hypothetical protein F4778DRAFT_775062 [Xylariomycetidae sp. FL2044]|nr:hypothetical protein F4778DRAFT_775062 [Xylariomycetidae sp. FL2044]